MKSMFFPVLPILLFTFVGCSGSSGRSYQFGTAKICAQNYNPLQFDMSQDGNYQKLDWPLAAPGPQTLPEGNFEYVDMEFYFVDKSTGFSLHTKDSNNVAKKAYETKVICGRNVGPDNDGLAISMSLPMVSKVQPSGKMSFESKSINVVYGDRIEVSSGAAPGDVNQAPGKVTEDQGLASQIYKVETPSDQPQAYEIRVTKEDDRFQKFGIIRFKKVP